MIDVSVIIPCYNSAHLIEKRVQDFESILNRTTWSWEIILSDDGSRDKSPEICERLATNSPKIKYLRNAVNRGRGRNVAEAIPLCKGRFVGYADADTSTRAVYILPLLNSLENGADMAIAHRTYKIKLNEFLFIAHRLASHQIYAFLVELLLDIHGHDTASGFKFFRRESALTLLDTARSPCWFWDTEIIANAHLLKLKIAEHPTLFIHTKSTGSTVHLLKDSWRQFWNLWRYAKKIKKELRQISCDCLPGKGKS